MRSAALLSLLIPMLAGCSGPEPMRESQIGASCPGQIAIARESRIKPGQEALFAKAVDDWKAWYRASGETGNSFLVGTVAVPGSTGKPLFDPSRTLTIHVNVPQHNVPGNDAAWDAFVKEFRESSDITRETAICLR